MQDRLADVEDELPPEALAPLAKAAWRLLPFIGLLYLVSFLDRVNIGFAALTMNADIGLSAAAYGLGAGIFFVGYVIFEVPSNIILERVGARRWIARIMITWGFFSAAMAFVTGPTSFLIVRFCLGVAEAGFFPGIILYLTYWFPGVIRARIMGWFLIALPLSSVLGGPFSTWLLGVEVFGLRGWQSMFILEGVPAIILGFVVWRKLPDRPSDARWLNADEAEIIERTIAAEAHVGTHGSLRAGLTSLRVWHLALIYFCIVVGLYGFSFWAPQAIKAFGDLSNQEVGWLTAIPYLLAIPAMIYWARSSDQRVERRWHIAGPAFLAAAAFIAAAYLQSPTLKLAAFSVIAVGIYACLPVFWTLPTAFLRGAGAAGGIALVNSIGNLGGYFGPTAIGFFKDRYGYEAGFLILAACLVAGGLLAIMLSRRSDVTEPVSAKAG